MAQREPAPPDGVLDSVTRTFTALHERHYGRRPAHAVTRLLDGDLLVCVMGEDHTEVEHMLAELQRRAPVQADRNAFQEAARLRFVAEVERVTERRVLAFLSDHHVDPALEVEIFLLEP